MSSLSELRKKMAQAKKAEEEKKAAESVSEADPAEAEASESEAVQEAEETASAPQEETAPLVQPGAQKIESFAPRMIVRRIYKSGGSVIKEDEEQVDLVATCFDPRAAICTVTAGGGLTLNLGEMQFAKFEAHVAVPAYLEEIDDALAYARAKVNDELNRQVAELSSDAGDD